MDHPLIYVKGSLVEYDEKAKRKNYVGSKAEPQLYTSFGHKLGGFLWGAFFTLLGLADAYVLFLYEGDDSVGILGTIVLWFGLLSIPIGLSVLLRSYTAALGAKPRSHRYLYLDERRIVSGTTREIGRTETTRISQSRGPQRIDDLIRLSSEYTEIPITSIDHVDVYKDPFNEMCINMITVTGTDSTVHVDVQDIIPSGNPINVANLIAFNSISQFYTKATGKSINASVKTAVSSEN